MTVLVTVRVSMIVSSVVDEYVVVIPAVVSPPGDRTFSDGLLLSRPLWCRLVLSRRLGHVDRLELGSRIRGGGRSRSRIGGRGRGGGVVLRVLRGRNAARPTSQ